MIDCQVKRVGPDATLVLELSGQLDPIGCDQLDSIMQRELSENVQRLVIDCQGLDYISSRGLGTLVQIHTGMKKRGGEARLAGVRGVIAEVIHVVRLDRALHLFPTVEAAMREDET